MANLILCAAGSGDKGYGDPRSYQNPGDGLFRFASCNDMQFQPAVHIGIQRFFYPYCERSCTLCAQVESDTLANDFPMPTAMVARVPAVGLRKSHAAHSRRRDSV